MKCPSCNYEHDSIYTHADVGSVTPERIQIDIWFHCYKCDFRSDITKYIIVTTEEMMKGIPS